MNRRASFLGKCISSRLITACMVKHEHHIYEGLTRTQTTTRNLREVRVKAFFARFQNCQNISKFFGIPEWTCMFYLRRLRIWRCERNSTQLTRMFRRKKSPTCPREHQANRPSKKNKVNCEKRKKKKQDKATNTKSQHSRACLALYLGGGLSSASKSKLSTSIVSGRAKKQKVYWCRDRTTCTNRNSQILNENIHFCNFKKKSRYLCKWTLTFVDFQYWFIDSIIHSQNMYGVCVCLNFESMNQILHHKKQFLS